MTVNIVFVGDISLARVEQAILGDSGTPNFSVSGETPTPERHDIEVAKKGTEIRVTFKHLSDKSELSGAGQNTDTESSIRNTMPNAVNYVGVD